MGAEGRIAVRDRRRREFFTLDNRIIDRFGPALGCAGIAVYTTLCRYGNESASAIISINRICTAVGLGRTKVKETIKLLEQLDLLLVHERMTGQEHHSHEYILLTPPDEPIPGWDQRRPEREVDGASRPEPASPEAAGHGQGDDEARPLPSAAGHDQGDDAARPLPSASGHDQGDDEARPLPAPLGRVATYPPVAWRPTPGRVATDPRSRGDHIDKKHHSEKHSQEDGSISVRDQSRWLALIRDHVRAGWKVPELIAAGLLPAEVWDGLKRSSITRHQLGAEDAC